MKINHNLWDTEKQVSEETSGFKSFTLKRDKGIKRII